MSPAFYFVVAALALLSTVVATPVGQLQKRRTFTLHQVARKKFLRNGPKQLAKDLAKYNVQAPEIVQVASVIAPSKVNGSAPAVPADAYDT